MIKKIILVASVLIASNAQAINSIDFLNFSSQPEFKGFAEDLTALLDHKPMVPAEPLGITGFDVGVSVTNTSMSQTSLRDIDVDYVTNSATSMQMITLHAHKGLPYDIDVGAAYSISASDDPISTFAYEISYAILSGNVALPAVNIKYTSTKLLGNSQIDYSSSAFELGVSKGFALFTPYASIATVSSTVSAKVAGKNALGVANGQTYSTVKSDLFKTSIGVNVNLTIMDLLVDMTKLGDNTSLSLKAGFRF